MSEVVVVVSVGAIWVKGITAVGGVFTSSFLQEVMPTLQNLDRWAKLQILDSLLELCANPVLWFKRNTEIIHSVPTISFPTLPPRIRLLPGLLPSRVFWEMKQNLLLCQELIQGSGTSLAELFHQLQKEVGSRVHPQDPQKILPGLAVTDYSLEKILLAEEPWFCPEIPAEPRLRCPYVPNEFTAPIPGTSLAQQIEWLQLQFGHRGPFIPIQIV